MKVNVIKVSYYHNIHNIFDEFCFVVSTNYDMWDKFDLYMKKHGPKHISNLEAQYFGNFDNGDDTYTDGFYGMCLLEEQTGIDQNKFREFSIDNQ